MKSNKYSTIIFYFVFGLILSITVHAGELGPVFKAWERLEKQNSTNTVGVLFHTDGNVNSSIQNIIGLMKTRDPAGFLNPYWIIDISDKATNTKTKCGLVVGTWYRSGYPSRGPWEEIMRNSTNYADLYAIVYSFDGGLRPISSQAGNVETLAEMCKISTTGEG